MYSMVVCHIQSLCCDLYCTQNIQVYSELADTSCEGDYVENLMLFVKTANFIIFKAPFNSNGIQNFPHTLKITRQSKGNKTSSHFQFCKYHPQSPNALFIKILQLKSEYYLQILHSECTKESIPSYTLNFHSHIWILALLNLHSHIWILAVKCRLIFQ